MIAVLSDPDDKSPSEESPRMLVHYRIRPSDPRESATALDAQRRAVHEYLSEFGGGILEEFVDTEDDAQPDTWPAYEAACRRADQLIRDGATVQVAIPSFDGIGSGKWFQPPPVSCEHKPLFIFLEASLAPIPAEIDVPDGAPAPACLLTIYRTEAGCEPVYLCNAGSAPLRDVKVRETTFGISHYASPVMDGTIDWSTVSRHTLEQDWPVLGPGRGVMISMLTTYTREDLRRFVVSYVDASGYTHTSGEFEMLLQASPQDDRTTYCWMPL